MVRLTKQVCQALLNQNDGFSRSTYNDQRNFNEERIYTVTDGKLNIRAVGKTSWSDSRYDKEWIASDEEVHRFLYKYQREMNTDGID